MSTKRAPWCWFDIKSDGISPSYWREPGFTDEWAATQRAGFTNMGAHIFDISDRIWVAVKGDSAYFFVRDPR